jgi:hypothetical protein
VRDKNRIATVADADNLSQTNACESGFGKAL